MNEKQKQLLSQSQPIARKWLFQKFQDGAETTPELENTLFCINTTEWNIYHLWHQKCLDDMRRVKLDETISDLFAKVADPNVSVKQALVIARRYYSNKEKAKKQKQTAKVISLLQSLADREKKLYASALQELGEEADISKFENLAHSLETLGARDSEDLLYTKQSLKHIAVLLKLGAKPSVHEIYQALEPRFASDSDLYQKQINVVLGTYQKGEDVPQDVKDVCFEFIQESIPHAGYFHANLIGYIFLNDTISERAFKLFKNMEKVIKDQGMGILVYHKALRIFKRNGIERKTIASLSKSDINIVRLMEMFQPA